MTDKHVLIVGPPGAGKRPANLASLSASRGDDAVVLDPHEGGHADVPMPRRESPNDPPHRDRDRVPSP